MKTLFHMCLGIFALAAVQCHFFTTVKAAVGSELDIDFNVIGIEISDIIVSRKCRGSAPFVVFDATIHKPDLYAITRPDKNVLRLTIKSVSVKDYATIYEAMHFVPDGAKIIRSVEISPTATSVCDPYGLKASAVKVEDETEYTTLQCDLTRTDNTSCIAWTVYDNISRRSKTVYFDGIPSEQTLKSDYAVFQNAVTNTLTIYKNFAYTEIYSCILADRDTRYPLKHLNFYAVCSASADGFTRVNAAFFYFICLIYFFFLN